MCQYQDDICNFFSYNIFFPLFNSNTNLNILIMQIYSVVLIIFYNIFSLFRSMLCFSPLIIRPLWRTTWWPAFLTITMTVATTATPKSVRVRVTTVTCFSHFWDRTCATMIIIASSTPLKTTTPTPTAACYWGWWPTLIRTTIWSDRKRRMWVATALAFILLRQPLLLTTPWICSI